VISDTLGELEFELEENEVTLNLNKNVTAEGEWGKCDATNKKNFRLTGCRDFSSGRRCYR
jgi:hypothetical protein